MVKLELMDFKILSEVCIDLGYQTLYFFRRKP